jgi:hypothetical protein
VLKHNKNTGGNIMKTIYINGVKATQKDLKTLNARVLAGIECIVEVHKTKQNNIAIVTA